jgi:hypothetical protein
MLALPMTEPNSLFSNVMIAIYSKSGMSGLGVGVADGVRVAVCVGVGDGIGVAVDGTVVGGTLGVLPQD